MKKNDVQVGSAYVVKVSGYLAPVRLEGISPYGGWIGRSIATGRKVRISTAAKLRRQLSCKDLEAWTAYRDR